MAHRFGRYLLHEKLADGGSAELWHATIPPHSRVYALKRILPDVARDPAFIRALADEALVGCALQHPNIVQVFELSVIDGVHYLVVEYVSGVDVAVLCAHHRRRGTVLPLPLAVWIAGQAAAALDHAHHRPDPGGGDWGILHGAVSPQKILLSWDGEVKLIDFMAETPPVRPECMHGRLAYATPERVLGMSLDARADIFALGLVLYELSTGTRAFTGEGNELLEMIENVDVPPSTGPLASIIAKALMKDPRDRYQTARAMYDALALVPGARRAELATYLRSELAPAFLRERALLSSYATG